MASGRGVNFTSTALSTCGRTGFSSGILVAELDLAKTTKRTTTIKFETAIGGTGSKSDGCCESTFASI